MKITLLVTTLNELGGMKEIMLKIKREWCDQIIILDGGSTDGTIEYAQQNGYFIYIQKKKGLINGLKEAWEFVEGDVVIFFQPDGNCVPEYIPPLIEKMREGYDMVIASRYAKGAKSYDDDILTGFGNWLFTKLVNLFFGGNYTDALVGFRAFRKQLIEDLGIDKKLFFMEWAQSKSILVGWDLQLSIRCAKRKLKTADIPGDEPARIYGKRKISPVKSGSMIIVQIIYELFRWR